jgi:hypothetical protein
MNSTELVDNSSKNNTYAGYLKAANDFYNEFGYKFDGKNVLSSALTLARRVLKDQDEEIDLTLCSELHTIANEIGIRIDGANYFQLRESLVNEVKKLLSSN